MKYILPLIAVCCLSISGGSQAIGKVTLDKQTFEAYMKWCYDNPDSVWSRNWTMFPGNNPSEADRQVEEWNTTYAAKAIKIVPQAGIDENGKPWQSGGRKYSLFQRSLTKQI